MKEVADLDGQLRQAIEEREAAVAANSALLNEQGSYESTAEVSERLLKTIEAHTATVPASARSCRGSMQPTASSSTA